MFRNSLSHNLLFCRPIYTAALENQKDLPEVNSYWLLALYDSIDHLALFEIGCTHKWYDLSTLKNPNTARNYYTFDLSWLGRTLKSIHPGNGFTGARQKCSFHSVSYIFQHLRYSKARLLELADSVCDLEKPSSAVGKMIFHQPDVIPRYNVQPYIHAG